MDAGGILLGFMAGFACACFAILVGVAIARAAPSKKDEE